MHDRVYFNGKFTSSAEPMIAALSAAALYGTGVFTTIAIYEGSPFLLEKHWRRLQKDGDKIGLDIDFISFVELESSLNELISANSVKNGRSRITIFDTSSTEIWKTDIKGSASVLITTGDFRVQLEQLRLTFSPYPINSRSPLAGVKSCNYLENLLASKEARSRGFHEAIRLNERGEITSASMANLFWLRDGELFTPTVETGCLAGTTREFILENFECEQAIVERGELSAIDSLYVCSAGLGIRQVKSLDDRSFATTRHAMLDLLPRADEKHECPRNDFVNIRAPELFYGLAGGFEKR
jgi:branched-subunit amino acid aminotransferase/4-amino-4-deoxychorismate lyase